MSDNQPLAFGSLAVGAILLTSALTGNGLGDILKGHFGSVSTTSSAGVAGVGTGLTATLASGEASDAADDSSVTSQTLTGAPETVDKMYSQALHLVGRPYVWGGGHSISDWLNAAGYDCSGFVSSVLGYAGIISSPQTTVGLAQEGSLASGPGKWVTIYDRTDAGTGQDHVIIDIAGHWFESGGSAQYNLSKNDGVSQISQPPESYLSTFNDILHPVGL